MLSDSLLPGKVSPLEVKRHLLTEDDFTEIQVNLEEYILKQIETYAEIMNTCLCPANGLSYLIGDTGTPECTCYNPSETRQCFQTARELYEAVTAYLQGGEALTQVANTYGLPIGLWCVGQLTDFTQIFQSQLPFNEDISDWDTSQATSMRLMFFKQATFNQDISQWNVEKVEDMSGMFSDCDAFNQDLSTWKTSSLMNTRGMFSRASAFNQDLSTWDTSKISVATAMFISATSFNQDLSMWNISSLSDPRNMFNGASSFRQDLCSWKDKVLSPFIRTDGMFVDTNCPLQTDPDDARMGPYCFSCA